MEDEWHGQRDGDGVTAERDQRAETVRRFVAVTRALASSGEVYVTSNLIRV